MNASVHHLNACTETWMHCESLLLTLSHNGVAYSSRTVSVIDECANVCLGTMEALRSGGLHLGSLALLCVGLCEECAEVCGRYVDDRFQACASICRNCSALLAPLAQVA
ncbi:MAG: hypothetical protein JWP27_184 [Flaviaesturariibacter sp.]|nr:hypothetical protein [Flaviaesturariibacter sp.]